MTNLLTARPPSRQSQVSERSQTTRAVARTTPLLMAKRKSDDHVRPRASSRKVPGFGSVRHAIAVASRGSKTVKPSPYANPLASPPSADRQTVISSSFRARLIKSRPVAKANQFASSRVKPGLARANSVASGDERHNAPKKASKFSLDEVCSACYGPIIWGTLWSHHT